MNNIEILEKFIKNYKEVQEKYKDDEIQAEIERSCYFEEVPAEAIENLIKEYKELKEHLQKYYNGELFTAKQLKSIEENQKKYFIHKSKVKEKIEETNSEKLNYNEDDYWFEQEVKGYAIDKLQELLEGGE